MKKFASTSRNILLLGFILFLTHCSDTPNNSEEKVYPLVKSETFQKAAVSSAHYLASEIGKEVLQNGGNAIDAAIAVQFALAVVYPVAGNIGGGGFMVIKTADGKYDALDFREMAPGKAHADMYLDDKGDVIDQISLLGHLACGVPGTVDGMAKAFDKYSKLKDWNALIKPAIKIAEEGYIVSEKQAKSMNAKRDDFEKANLTPIPFVKSTKWKKGDLLVQKDLAATLRRVAQEGRDGFYKGKTAELFVKEMEKGGGIISLEDLENYKAVWRKPLISDYKDYTIISMPPPSSGGIALIQLLNSIEPFDIKSMGFQSPETVHLMCEAERRVYADRATHLGDSDFYFVPQDTLITDAYNNSRMANFDPKKATPSDSIQAGVFKESEQTTHFSILDQYGNAVSLTTTINTAYGSKVVVEGAGFILNNEMDDFSAKPGVPNYFGLVGNEANKIEPGKRMLSSMTPSIVEKNGKTKIVVGTPGGSTIITSVFQTIVNIIEFEMNANDATQAPRFHHQWLPDKIQVEYNCLNEETRDALKALGHEFRERGTIGKVETILINDDGTVEAAADHRGDDSVSGF